MPWTVSLQPKPTAWLTGDTEPLYCRVKDADTGAVAPSLTGASFSGKLIQGSTTQALGGTFALLDATQALFQYTRVAADVGSLTVGRYQLQFKITLASGEVIQAIPLPIDVGTGA